jgi:hypothetical protein
VPITIAYPDDGAPFGPGFRINLSSDLVGPPAVGFKWQLDLFGAPPVESIYCRWTFQAPDLEPREYITGDDDLNDQVFGPADPRMPQGSDALLRVVLLDGTQVQESIDRPVKIDYTSGAPRSLAEKILGMEGGMTGAQAEQLMQLHVLNVWSFLGAALPELGGILSTYLPNVLTCIPHGSPISGDGELHRGSDPNSISALGFRFDVVSRAPGIGIDEGAPDKVEIAAVQFAATKLDRDGNEVWYDSWIEYGITGAHLWNINDRIYRLHYSVTPGLEVTVCWLTLF